MISPLQMTIIFVLEIMCNFAFKLKFIHVPVPIFDFIKGLGT